MVVVGGLEPTQAPAAGRRPGVGGARGRDRGGRGGVSPARQAAGRDGTRCRGWRMGTEGNKLMPRKLGPTKAHLLGQCSSP